MSIKDQRVRNVRVLVSVGRRHDGARGDDPLCAYDALASRWERVTGLPVPESGGLPSRSVWRTRPVFTAADQATAVDTADVRDLAVRMARAAGEETPEDFGGKSFRIGGASDMRDRLGLAAREMIEGRGRWHSDIAFIYQRVTVHEQLLGSVEMGAAQGDDLESVVRGYWQPGR